MIIELKNPESNYAAKLQQLKSPKIHPNGDNLLVWNIAGDSVITDKSYKEGDWVIFIPAMAQVDKKILSELNMFEDKTLNKDGRKKGYVGNKGVIRSINLKGLPSNGIVLKYDSVLKDVEPVEQYFDTIDDTPFCWKYEPISVSDASKILYKQANPEKPNYFKFHYDTVKFDKIKDSLTPETDIVITYKYHGTSGISALLPRKKSPGFIGWVKDFIRDPFGRKQYQYMWSSRRVVKGSSLKDADVEGCVWTDAFKKVKHGLLPGYTLYYEIIGNYNGKDIQKGYDYMQETGRQSWSVIIYRITHTDEKGNVRELDWLETMEYCNEQRLARVTTLYAGKYNEKAMAVINKYTTGNCTLCTNIVPREGVCIRIESDGGKAYKVKSQEFILKESDDMGSNTTPVN